MPWILNYVRDPPLPLQAPLQLRRRSVLSNPQEQADNVSTNVAASTAAAGDELANTGPSAVWDLAELDVDHMLQCAVKFERIYLPKDHDGEPQLDDY
jgi:hypothetical protein